MPESLPLASRDKYAPVVVMLGTIAAAALVMDKNYLLFHTFSELFSAAVALVIFSIAWHTRRIASSDYVTFLGMSSLAVGLITILHALSYKGLPVFPAHDANLPTTLWVITRALQASAFLIAPAFVNHKLRHPSGVLAIYLTLAGGLSLAAFYNLLPAAYVEGSGLTAFKIGAEYAIIGATMLGALLLMMSRSRMKPIVRRLLYVSMASSAVAEVIFTLYNNPYGLTNRAGHLAHLLAFLLLYLALVRSSLEEPLTSIFAELEESRRELTQAYEIEHSIAETLQAGMVFEPQDVEGIELGHAYMPAPGLGRIGGDFYDVFGVSDEVVAFVIGDVCGKGLPAAMVTVKSRSAIRALALVDPEPVAMLRSLNAYLWRQLPSDSFVTLIFGTIHRDSGRVELAIAGHPDPVLCGDDGSQLTSRRTHPLGITPQIDPSICTFTMRPEQVLVLVTDGVTEALGSGADRFGVDRLQACLHGTCRDMTAQAVVDSLVSTVADHGGGSIDDDVAVVAIRYAPLADAPQEP